MKESISNALITNLIITFLFILVILFAGSSAYTKAFKVKNRIISILERYEMELANNTDTKLPTNINNEINSILSDVGYRVQINNDTKCQTDLKKRFKNNLNDNYKIINTSSNYRYCIARFDTREGQSMKASYYAVVTYMYFEIPLIGATLEFPVYGETKIMGLAY